MQSQFDLRFGPFTIDRARRIVLRDGVQIPLTLKCVELLVALASNPHKPMSKKELLEAAWRDSTASDATLAQHVWVLRSALKSGKHQWIRTVPRCGYRFDGDVEQRIPAGPVLTDRYRAAADVLSAVPAAAALRGAADVYKRLSELDRDADAYATEARCWRRLAIGMLAPPRQALDEAHRAAHAALAQDRAHVQARIEAAYVALYRERDFDAALDALPREDRALRAAAHVHLAAGNFSAALTAARRGGHLLLESVVEYYAQRFEDSARKLAPLVKTDARAALWYAACRLAAGEVETAYPILRRITHGRTLSAPLQYYAYALLLLVQARLGNRGVLRRDAAALQRTAQERFVSPALRAIVHALLGEAAQAASLRQEADVQKDPWALFIGHDPLFA